MKRHAGPWTRSRSSRLGGWRFPSLVLIVAVLAFCLTLNWPLRDGMGSENLVRGSAQLPPPTRPQGDLTCVVASITDGDTLRCRDGTRIRLHAVAARERDGSCSPGHLALPPPLKPPRTNYGALLGARRSAVALQAKATIVSLPSAGRPMGARSTAQWFAAALRWFGIGLTGRARSVGRDRSATSGH